MGNIMLYIGTSIMLVISIALAVLFVSFHFRSKKENLSYKILELTSLPDFSGDFKAVSVYHVEMPFSFFYEVRNNNGDVIKSFDPDWSKDNIQLWASKNGYIISSWDF